MFAWQRFSRRSWWNLGLCCQDLAMQFLVKRLAKVESDERWALHSALAWRRLAEATFG